MTTLVFETLSTDLSQEFNLKLDNRYNVLGFYPYLYLHNSPSGTFTFEIMKDAVSLFSKSFTSADIKSSLSTANNYAHVFYPVLPNAPLLLEKGTYTAKLSCAFYSPSGSSFLGWIRQHEDLVNDLDYVPASDAENPFALKLKVLKQTSET